MLLDGILGTTTVTSQTRSNYRNYLRRVYRFAQAEGIETNGASSTKLWAPAPQNGTVTRRAQVAYDRFVRWAIGRSIWSDTVTAPNLREWALAEKSKSNRHRPLISLD